MSKHRTLLAVAGLLLMPGCIITTNDSSSDTNTSPSTNTNTDGDTTTGTTTTPDTTGGTTVGEDTTTTGGTTIEQPTTTLEPTTSGTTADTTSDTTSETTGGGLYGNCGWHPAEYYECEVDGGQPGVEDPGGVSPIACPATLPADGDKCDMDSEVNNVGCCTPEGVLYFCNIADDANTIVVVDCD